MDDVAGAVDGNNRYSYTSVLVDADDSSGKQHVSAATVVAGVDDEAPNSFPDSDSVDDAGLCASS